jgi:nucleoside-diphosphate-sugar epimerase
MSKTAFVTGASGFVGSELVRELHRQGWTIHLLARATASLDEIEGVPYTLHTGDITDPDTLAGAIPKGADAVFHVAASTNFWSQKNAEQTRINVDGTRHMIKAAEAAGAGRFVHTSSFVTWGFQESVIDEDTPRVSTSDWINYVRTKHQAEEAVLDAVDQGRLDAVVLNPANVLGPGDWHNWSRLFRMIHLDSLPGVPPGGGSFCDVREVAGAHIQAFHDGGSGEKYLLGGHYATMLEVARTAAGLLGRPAPARTTPAWLLRGYAELAALAARFSGKEPELTPEAAVMASRQIVCDSSKAQKELAYGFTPVPDMIHDTIEWMRTKGLLE